MEREQEKQQERSDDGRDDQVDPESGGGDGEAQMNEMYSLLDAASMTVASSISANTHDGLSSGGFNDLKESYGTNGFRNAAGILSDHEGHTVYNDVYRSVDVMDNALQHNAAALGERRLDDPFLFSAQETEDTLGHPTPRTFSKLRMEHSHFHMVCPLKELVEMMSSELVTIGADMMYSPSGCFWRAMFYPSAPNVAVDFRVYMNSCPEIGNNRFVVEFVRRSGCTMAFNQLFAAIRASFMGKRLVTKDNGDIAQTLADLPTPFQESGIEWAKAPSSISSNFPSDDDIDSDGPPRVALSRASSSGTIGLYCDAEEDEFELDIPDEEMFKPLFDLSSSDFEDIHVQGLALVSNEAKNEGHCERMLSACPELLPLIVQRLKESSHPEVRRHCCTALSGIAANEDLHDRIIEADALPVLTNIAGSMFSPATGETQRQAANALSNLCKRQESLSAVSESVAGMEDHFLNLAQKDRRLADSIATVQKALQA